MAVLLYNIILTLSHGWGMLNARHMPKGGGGGGGGGGTRVGLELTKPLNPEKLYAKCRAAIFNLKVMKVN